MTEKRQTSQGYIIRILQHFATKLRNITKGWTIRFLRGGGGLGKYQKKIRAEL